MREQVTILMKRFAQMKKRRTLNLRMILNPAPTVEKEFLFVNAVHKGHWERFGVIPDTPIVCVQNALGLGAKERK